MKAALTACTISVGFVSPQKTTRRTGHGSDRMSTYGQSDRNKQNIQNTIITVEQECSEQASPVYRFTAAKHPHG